MNAHQIVLAGQEPHIQRFAAWLESQGHTAETGCTRGNFVDGRWAAQDDRAHEVMLSLWSSYASSGVQQ